MNRGLNSGTTKMGFLMMSHHIFQLCLRMSVQISTLWIHVMKGNVLFLVVALRASKSVVHIPQCPLCSVPGFSTFVLLVSRTYFFCSGEACTVEHYVLVCILYQSK